MRLVAGWALEDTPGDHGERFQETAVWPKMTNPGDLPGASCGFFGKGFLRESVFLSWITPHLEYLMVDKTYDFTA